MGLRKRGLGRIEMGVAAQIGTPQIARGRIESRPKRGRREGPGRVSVI